MEPRFDHDLDGDTLETEYRPERLLDLDDLEVRQLVECACGSSHWTPWHSPSDREASDYQDARQEEAEFEAEQAGMDSYKDRRRGL